MSMTRLPIGRYVEIDFDKVSVVEEFEEEFQKRSTQDFAEIGIRSVIMFTVEGRTLQFTGAEYEPVKKAWMEHKEKVSKINPYLV